jgi:hypothetical protein
LYLHPSCVSTPSESSGRRNPSHTAASALRRRTLSPAFPAKILIHVDKIAKKGKTFSWEFSGRIKRSTFAEKKVHPKNILMKKSTKNGTSHFYY